MSSGPRSNLSALRRWASGLREEVGADAVRAGQAVILAGIVRRAPVRTGRLRRSVHATRPVVRPGFAAGAVVVGARYGPFVEFGTAGHPAEKFVRPAVREDGPQAEQAMARVIGRAF